MLKFSKLFKISLILGSLFVAGLVYAADGSNYVNVYSCQNTEKGILVRRDAKEEESVLENGIRDAGYGLRDYYMKCVAQDRYYVEWKDLSTPQASGQPTTRSVTALPDFVIKEITLSPNNAVTDYGDVLTIRAKNIGTGDAPKDNVSVYIWIDDQLEWTYNSSTLTRKDFLKAGGMSDIQPQILRGKHSVKACMDYTNFFQELDESNNCMETVLIGKEESATPTTTPTTNPTPTTSCQFPNVEYQGRCMEQFPACENPPSGWVHCTDKIENGKRISRYNLQCGQAYIKTGSECVLPTSTTVTTCPSPYVLYQGQCADPIPACRNGIANSTSCIDKIENGKYIEHYSYSCLPGYENRDDQCVKPSATTSATLSCGNSGGSDGLYSGCVGDVISYKGSGEVKALIEILAYDKSSATVAIKKPDGSGSGRVLSKEAILLGTSIKYGLGADTTNPKDDAILVVTYKELSNRIQSASYKYGAFFLVTSNQPTSALNDTSCAAPYVLYQGKCVDPVPACENPPANYMPSSCVDKIENGQRISRYDFRCVTGYIRSSSECILSSNASPGGYFFTVTLVSSPRSTNGNIQENGYLAAKVGNKIQFKRIIEQSGVVNNAWNWYWDKTKLDCSGYPDFDSPDLACKVIDNGSSVVYITMFPTMKSGEKLSIQSNMIKVYTETSPTTTSTPVPTSTSSVTGSTSTPVPVSRMDTGITTGYEDEVITAATKNPFSDTDLNTMEGQAAANLNSLGIIGGFPDGTFKGNRRVNRAEAAKFLLLSRYSSSALSDVSNNGKFWDVMDGQWYTRFIMNAYIKGLMSGYPDGSMGPGKNVNTAEFLKMLSLNFALPTNLPHSYGDVSPNDWFAQYAGIAQQYNLFPDRKTMLLPGNELARAEVAIALYQYLSKR
ncbi:MAG: S-layer homology domain-containing protein [Candidatus Peregrinibacteria bacterium]